ncbi:hypothetical protein F4804DRAFT_317546 [Jackrogersella minutella]|nr:hypothetical protein F4804DRAFT_317546 [Jackrogersella minutella]
MQKSNLRRLSTPTQPPPRPPSGQYISQLDEYPQHITAHRYRPQQVWTPEYRPILGGPRAVPLRMQRVAMNRTDTRPMAIPSLQLSSDRPYYSVPSYPRSRTASESSSSFARPPRPPSASEANDIDTLVPRRVLPFPPRRTSQRNEGDYLMPPTIDTEYSEIPTKISKSTRAVAKRGSQKSQSDNSARERGHLELSPARLPSEQNSSEQAGSQKRAIGHTAVDSYPPKRIKINVIRSKTQTSISPKVSKQTYPAEVNHHLRYTQASKNSFKDKTAPNNQLNKNLEEIDDDETESSTDSEDEVTNTTLTSKRLGQIKATGTAEPDPYDSADDFGPLRKAQSNRNLDTIRAVKADYARVPSDISWGSSTPHQDSHVSSQPRRYINSSAQCDLPSEAADQVKPERKVPEQSTPTPDEPPTTAERKPSEETLGSRLSRIEAVMRAQEGKRMDEFVKARLAAGGPNMLETLTNEILLALVVPDDELLEQVVKIM